MTNGEKYTTAHDRAVAFRAFCDTHDRVCTGCPLDCNTKALRDESLYAWLDLEAEDEKPLPCPFCGNTVMHKHDEFADPKVFVVCPTCGYRSRWEFNLGVAIAAHNRVAKKCREGRE